MVSVALVVLQKHQLHNGSSASAGVNADHRPPPGWRSKPAEVLYLLPGPDLATCEVGAIPIFERDSQMMRSLRNQGTTIAHHLALLGVTCLVLIACGSSEPGAAMATAESAAQSIAVFPTAVPTTPPLSLPPADVPLPTLAALPATSMATQTEAAAPVTQVPAGPTTNDSGESESGGTEADATESGAPESGAPQPAGILGIASADRWSDCILAAAQNSEATALLDPIDQGTTVDMTSVQLNTLAAASTGCDMVTNTLESTDIGDYVSTSSSCLDAWLESSGGGSVFVGLASIGRGQSTPAWAQPHLVDALDACFVGASFAADVMAVVSADPSLSGAFDAGCLATSFDTSGTMRAFAQALASNPATATLYVGLDDPWVLSCANVGQMVAVAAAADGVALSAPTIGCIDSELKGTGVVAGLVAGTADADAVGIATIACLTDAEATALLD